MAEGAEYDRGHAAGTIDARLDAHDAHFRAINGSLGDVAVALNGLKLEVQRLGDQAVSRDATVITTAAALKDAEAARRDKGDQSWSPWARAFAVIAAVSAAVGLLAVVRWR